MNAKKVLNNLQKFYRNEANGLGHYQDDLTELAWQLAEILESEGPDSNIWKNDEEDFEAFLIELRSKCDVATIDTTVNHMHQGLLDALDWSGGMSEDMLMMCEGDIAEYLLTREN